MKTQNLSARGGSDLGGKKLILCMTLAAVVVLLFAAIAFAEDASIISAPRNQNVLYFEFLEWRSGFGVKWG